MAAAIEKAGVKFQTRYFNRGLPDILYMKQLVDDGTFGKITRIRGSNCHNGHSAVGSTPICVGWPTPKSPAAARSVISARICSTS